MQKARCRTIICYFSERKEDMFVYIELKQHAYITHVIHTYVYIKTCLFTHIHTRICTYVYIYFLNFVHLKSPEAIRSPETWTVVSKYHLPLKRSVAGKM